MEKKVKILFKCLFTFILSLFIIMGVDRVEAAEVVQGKIVKTLESSQSDIMGTGSLSFTRKTAIDSENNTYIAYCIQPTVTFSKDASCTKTDTALPTSIRPKISYILSYYDRVDFTKKKHENANLSDKEYFITQMALWYLLRGCQTTGTYRCSATDWKAFNNFLFDFNTPSSSTYASVSNDVAIQIANIIKGTNTVATIPTASIKLNANNISFKRDGDYYVSSAISVTAVNINGGHTVSLLDAPSGTIVADGSGASRTKFGVNELFYVKVPTSAVSSVTNIKFSLKTDAQSNRIYDPYGYDCAGGAQDITIIKPRVIPVTDKVDFSLTVNSARISKVDLTSKDELPGAHLMVKDSDGNVIDEWISTKEPHYITDLKPGEYTLIETIAPDGYALSTEEQKFTITDGGDIPTIYMTNDKTKVSISKVSMTSNEELPGAHLVLKDSNDKVIEEWDSQGEPHVIYGLVKGEYYITETIAPDGYILSEETVKVVIKEDGTADPVVMKNEITRVEISKQDATTGKELAGAHLILKDSEDRIVEEWDSTEEVHVITGLLTEKEYTLIETIAPDGYEVNPESVKFTIQKDGTVDKVIMKNDRIPEQVPTGDILVTVISAIAVLGLGVGYYFYKKRSEVKI